MQVVSPLSPPQAPSIPFRSLPQSERYRLIRAFTEHLCAPLETEDYLIQSMEDVSPTKWHLAHVSWFFETFLLKPFLPTYTPLNPQYAYLFNSYYTQVGDRHCRPNRGLISRPTVAEVYAYRHYVDEHMQELLATASAETREHIRPIVELGLHHEQQHQELLLTDLKHVFSMNPLYPIYRPAAAQDRTEGSVPPMEWQHYEGGLVEVGHEGMGFSFDNEGPRHQTFIQPFRLASRLVTNAEYLAFIEDDGYADPVHWLSMGFATAGQHGWRAPLYWEQRDGVWHEFTLAGLRQLHPDEPVCHISYFEADAYARWAGARLATEFEWEVATLQEAPANPAQHNFVEAGTYHPQPVSASASTSPDASALQQVYGDLWEWTQSAYSAYPGYRPAPGAIGEYNGKFMCNQYVLRGGSCATSVTHIRPTYRNFFPPDARWQFTGIRLAQDL